jgi:NADH-quinone oxidoreductase subunit N
MLDWTVVSQDLGLLMPIIIIWATASLILLGDVWIWKGRRDTNPLVAIIGVAGALVYQLANPSQGDATIFASSAIVDSLTSMSCIALYVTALLSILMAWTYLRVRGIDHGEYYVLLLLSISGGMLMAMANDLIVLFLGLEILSFALYVLAGFARTDERSEEASIKYFLLGAFASAFFLYGIALIYGATAATNLHSVQANMRTLVHAGSPNPMLLAGIALTLVGLGFKAAVIPFHQWTPDVYEGAPTSVTAFMAGAAKIGAFAAMLRVFSALQPAHAYWLPAVQMLAILTMVIGNLYAVTQTNLKRMLAYSSIAHAGYLLVSIAATSHFSKAVGPEIEAIRFGTIFYLFAYTFMTLGAFGVMIYLSGGGRDIQYLSDVRGLAKTHPIAAYTMMFFMLSLGGIPPTMGFMGKWQIFMSAVYSNEIILAVVMGLASVIAVFYYLRVVYMMIFEEPIEAAPVVSKGERPARISIVIAATATVLFGIVPHLLFTATQVKVPELPILTQTKEKTGRVTH